MILEKSNLGVDEKARILVAGLIDDNNEAHTPPSFNSEFDAISEGLKELSPELYEIKKFTKGFTISDLGKAIEEYKANKLKLVGCLDSILTQAENYHQLRLNKGENAHGNSSIVSMTAQKRA